MSVYRSHIILPVDEGTIQAGLYSVKKELEKELINQNLDQEIKVLEAGTLGIVGKGVILAVYPEQVHYYNVKENDIKRIVQEHFLKGRIVTSLEHVLATAAFSTGEMQPIGLTRKQDRIVLDKGWKLNSDNIEEVLAAGGYQGLEKIFSENISADQLIELVIGSGLRGRGGAGFPTGLKWKFTRQAQGDQKYLICNADEGEPGTFKDRLILEGDPHKLIEAMIIGGYAIGASQGYVYIRGEYELSIQRLQKAIDQAKEYNLLGTDILGTGFTFNLEIKKGAGAYVCGEETALIESLEGKRGNPRLKPPYPVTHGLWQKPTAVNNVETLANIPQIVFHGAEWFRKFGTDKCPGTKVFTILGHVEFPGLIEVEMGTTLREIIYNYGGGIKGGKKFKAALIGGAAGVFLSENMLDVRMDFENLKENAAALGSGAVLVMDEDSDMADMLFSILKFFAHESCGQCAPCRLGTHQLVQYAYQLRQGQGQTGDLEKMLNIVEAMRSISLCPLGQSPIMPVKSAIKNFRAEFEAKLINK